MITTSQIKEINENFAQVVANITTLDGKLTELAKYVTHVKKSLGYLIGATELLAEEVRYVEEKLGVI